MRALRNGAPLVQHDDFCHVRDGRHARRDHDGRGVSMSGAQRHAQVCVGAVVECAGRVVQQQNFRVAGQRAGDQQALPLSAGQVRALRVQVRVQSVRQLQQIRRLRVVNRPVYALLGNLASQHDVLVRGVGVHHVGLERNAEHAVQRLGGNLLDVHAVDQNFALVHVVEAHQQKQNRALAGAGRADQTQRFAALQPEADVRKRGLALVVGEGDVSELDMIRALGRVAGGQHGEILRRGQHLFDAVRRSAGAGHNHKNARQPQHAVGNDGEIVQKRHDLARLRQSPLHAVCAHDQHDDQTQIQKQRGERRRKAHHRVGAHVVARGAVGLPAEAVVFIIALGQRLDHARAGDVLAHDAHQLVQRFLKPSKQRNALHGNHRHRHADQRHGRQQHQRHRYVLKQRDDDAAEQQNRRAHAQPLYHAHHLMHVIGVRCQAGNQRRHRKRVHLRAGEIRDAGVQVMAHGARHVARDGGGVAVGDHVARDAQKREEDHRAAPEEDFSHAFLRHNIVNNIGKKPRKHQLAGRADQLDQHADRDAPGQRTHVFQNRSHAIRLCLPVRDSWPPWRCRTAASEGRTPLPCPPPKIPR